MEEETRIITQNIFVPNPEDALKAWNQYQLICEKLLNDSDYVAIRGKKHRKRTGWAKLRRAFNITTEVISAEWEQLPDDDFGYNVTIRAIFPDGRFEDGDGYCDSGEMKKGNIALSRHNVRSKAITRAKNRATADLIGSGEVSAEEFIDGETTDSKPSQKSKQQPPKPEPTSKAPPSQQKKKDGHRTPVDNFFDEVQKETANYYDSKEHLYNALGKQWPKFDSEEEIDDALQAAIDHAKQKADEKAAEEESPF